MTDHSAEAILRLVWWEAPLLLAFVFLVWIERGWARRRLRHPIELFSVWVHEMAHGLAAILLGGSFTRMEVLRDTSGRAWTRRPAGRMNQVFVVSAGYLGTAMVASALIGIRHVVPFHETVLQVLGISILVSVVLFMRNGYGAAMLSLIGGSLIAVGLFAPSFLAKTIYFVLALGTAARTIRGLNHIANIRVRTVSPTLTQGTDAHTVARVLGGTPRIWAALWLGMAWAMILVGIGVGSLPALAALSP